MGQKLALLRNKSVDLFRRLPSHVGNKSDGPSCREAIIGGLIVLFVFFGGAGYWAVTAPLASAARANGQVIVEGRSKTIQHLEGGIIREILVKEGEFVRTGQPLMKLDSTQSGASEEMHALQRFASIAEKVRLEAERDNMESLNFPEALQRRAVDPRIKKLLDNQIAIFESRKSATSGEISIHQQRIEQLRAEIESYESQKKSQSVQLALIQDEHKDAHRLWKKGIMAKPKVLQLEREAARLTGNRDNLNAQIARAGQKISETELSIQQVRKRQNEEVNDKLEEVEKGIVLLDQQLRASKDVLDRTVIKSPTNGIVENLRFVTPGGVINRGEPVLDVVPTDKNLIVEARVRRTDIDSIYKGLDADVDLLAYNSRNTPTLKGRVDHLSADAVTDKRSQESFYLVRVSISQSEVEQLEGVDLYPGMPVEVMIRTGERTFLEYLAQPISQSFRRAFREN